MPLKRKRGDDEEPTISEEEMQEFRRLLHQNFRWYASLFEMQEFRQSLHQHTRWYASLFESNKLAQKVRLCRSLNHTVYEHRETTLRDHGRGCVFCSVHTHNVCKSCGVHLCNILLGDNRACCDVWHDPVTHLETESKRRKAERKQDGEDGDVQPY